MTLTAYNNEDLRELYRELILDHARSPRHFGKLPDATHSAEGINPLCGDKLKMYFRIDDQNRISDARFEGSGCAISVASASLLTDTVIGLNTDDALKYFSALVGRLVGKQAAGNDDADTGINLGKLRALEGVKEFPSRVKCATLAWHALNSAIHHDAQPATTE
jgi:nitrogen fixation protein NifU and related proteins